MPNRIVSTSCAVVTLLAFQVAPAQTHRHHHRLAKIAGGVGAYELAKKTGKNRVAHGGKRNFFQKHPIVSGLLGAHVAGKVAKHHRHGG